MIYIFGDSHANFNFRGLTEPHYNLHQPSITMHRIGRDGYIINFDQSFCSVENTFILCYGEVDCRCHVARQIATGRELNEICNELINKYIETIQASITEYRQIILCSITPPLRRREYEDIHGPITHEFPFIGTDEERVKYTLLMNKLLKEAAEKNGYRYLDLWSHYARSEDGTLNSEYSDSICHIINNTFILEQLQSRLYEQDITA